MGEKGVFMSTGDIHGESINYIRFCCCGCVFVMKFMWTDPILVVKQLVNNKIYLLLLLLLLSTYCCFN